MSFLVFTVLQTSSVKVFSKTQQQEVDSMGDIEAAVKALKAGVDVLKVLRASTGTRVVP